MKILWVLNKYVEGGSLSLYYPDFLQEVENEISKSGHEIKFIFFSDAMKRNSKTKNNFYFNPKRTKTKDVNRVAAELEDKYQFTFKQAYFPEQIQVSKSQDYRQIHLPEKEFRDLSFLVPKFLYLEKIINQEKIDVVFCDQSAEFEMEFARSICQIKKKIFMRQSELFLGRCVFYQQFEFGKERIALPILDKTIKMSYVKEFVEDFIKNNRLPYLPRPSLKANIKEFYLPRLMHFYQYPQFIKLALMSPFLSFEEKILKPIYEDKFDKDKPYLFLGFHLPTESTISLRALPYNTQSSLVESICRVLPYGHYLYVREHPICRKHYPVSFIRKLKQLPCVKVISPKIPISTILKHSQGVLTYNATTGIEALLYGKPVLSFAPNVYYGLHPAVDFCSDLFELGPKLVKLINTKVKKEDTYKYVFDLMRSTSNISLAAGTFLSKKDSNQRAHIFSKELLSSIEYCRKNDFKNKSMSN